MRFPYRILVTRPEREAGQWVRKLSALGLDAKSLPLINIAPPGDIDALRNARIQMGGYAAVMFVSVNAVRGFLGEFGGLTAASALELASIARGTRAWSPGPGTTKALVEAGWPAGEVDAPAPDAPQFDSEALWGQVECQLASGQQVLIVRGADAQGHIAGRDWLAGQLRARGVVVDEVAAYCRAVPTLNKAQRDMANSSATDGSVWLFSSSEAISNLGKLLPERDWAAARAVATHDRIEKAARQAGFGQVIQARPTLEAVAASIESLL